MSNSFFGWFLKPKRLASSPHIDALFSFLRDLVNREDLIEDIWKEYLHVSSLSTDQQDAAYLAAYVKLEEFIVTNKPLVVKQELSRETLRSTIREKQKVGLFPPSLQLLFLPEKERILQFFQLISKELVHQIVGLSGAHRLQEIGGRLLKVGNTVVFRLDENGVSYADHPDAVSAGEIQTALQELYRLLYIEVVAALGQSTALAIIRRSYEQIEKKQSIEMLSDFFAYMPEGVLMSERLSHLSREELEVRIAEATAQEKKKREEAQQMAGELKGKIKQVEVQNKAMEDTKRAMLNLLEDERKLETTLKDERDRARAIISSVGEGLFAVDKAYRITMVNPVAEEMLGFSGGDLVGKNLADVTVVMRDGKPLEKEERPLAKTLISGEPFIGSMADDFSLKTPKGAIPIALITAPLKRDTEIVGALVTFRDVTLEKQTQETIERTVQERTLELRQEQARLTASINSLVVGFILTDPDGKIITKNPAVISILNLSEDIVSLSDIEKKLSGAIQLYGYHKKVQEEAKPISLPNVTFGAKYLRIFVAPIFLSGPGSDFLGTVILIQDQTEEKILERSKDEFFSIASHELRTPLTAIRGNTSMMMEYFKEELKSEELKEMLTDVYDSSVRLISIVNDFLDIGRLEQGRMQFRNEVFDLGALIEGVLKEYQVTGSRQKLYLRFEPPEKPVPPAYADKTRVKQVLINLVGNALKFTEEGGVTVRVYLYDGYVRVVVEDTGHGIPYENQMLLFRKFQQAGDSLFTRDTIRGTGLGLYISKLMMEGMGGTIGLQYSQPGKGSAFGFAVPIAPDSHPDYPKLPPAAIEEKKGT